MSTDYIEFIQSFSSLTGIDLAQYKEAQMKRRLTSLYEKKGYENFRNYFEDIRTDPVLLDELLDKMTINVSEFYRNGQRWELLEKEVLPGILHKKTRLNVWSAACSTGEEPYTLFMVLSRLLPISMISILATDIDEKVLTRAKTGTYLNRSLQELPSDLRDRWFEQTGDFFQVKEEVKKAVTFKKQNLLSDPFPRKMDLIVCRNVLIYFTEEAKHLLFRKFADALQVGGILFVGSTEQMFRPEEYDFKVVSPFFYKKIDPTR